MKKLTVVILIAVPIAFVLVALALLAIDTTWPQAQIGTGLLLLGIALTASAITIVLYDRP